MSFVTFLFVAVLLGGPADGGVGGGPYAVPNNGVGGGPYANAATIVRRP